MTKTIQIRPAPPQPYISIETFDRSAEEITINEPASLEAMRRLGIRPFELVYKTPQSFVKTGCDDSVTKYFHKKWEEQRNLLIEQVIEKRNEVINEKATPKKESAEVRRELIMIDFDKKRLQQIDRKGEDTLRHMFMKHLREIQRQKLAQQAYNRSIQRANEIQRQQTERLMTARIAANNFVFKSREIKPEQATFREPTEDPVEMRRKAIRDELAKQRREQWIEKEKQIQSARQRSQEILEQKINSARQTIQRDDQRFSAWKEKNQQAAINKTVPKIRSYEEVSKVLKQREEDRRTQILNEIQTREMRFDGNRNRIAEETKQKYQNISRQEQEKMDRVVQARLQMEKEAQLKREQYLKESQMMQKNAEMARTRDMLKVAEKICERDDKLAQAQRRRLAIEYEQIRAKQQTEEDKRMALQAQQERQKVTAMKTGAQLRLQQRKERLERELNKLHSVEDTRTLNNIRNILEISEDEMQNMISSSLQPTSKTT